MFLYVILWASFCVRATTGQYHSVLCADHLYDGQGDDAQCRVEYATAPPWSEETRTAPAPSSLKSEPEVMLMNNESHIRINISWIQKDMKGVEGFHLELLHIEPPGQPRHYMAKINFNNLTTIRGPVMFFYSCCGKPESYPIHPQEEFVIKIQALPMYRENDNPQALRSNLTIPACRNKVIRKADICINRRRPRPPRDKSPNRNNGENVSEATLSTKVSTESTGYLSTPGGFWTISNHVLIIICSMVAILTVLVVIFLCRIRKIRKYHAGVFRRTKGQIVMVPSNILLISTTHEDYLDAMNNLISIVQRFDHVDLTTNLRSSVEIGRYGMTEWLKDRMLRADCVVLMPAFEYEHTPTAVANLKKGSHQIAMAVSVAKNLIVSQHIPAPRKKFFIVDLNNCVRRDHLIFFKHYELPKDVENLLKCLLGRHSRKVPAEDKDNFKKLLSSALLYNCPKPAAMAAKGPPPLKHENDLDYLSLDMGSDIKAGLDEDLNIGFEMESCPPQTSDQSVHCITTDFNTEDLSTQNFLKAGARPKGHCL